MQTPGPGSRPQFGLGGAWNQHFNTGQFLFILKLERPGLGFLRSQLPLLSTSRGSRGCPRREGEAPRTLVVGSRRQHSDPATSHSPRVTRPKGPRRLEAGGWLVESRDPAVSTTSGSGRGETAQTPDLTHCRLMPVCCATGGVTSH